MDKGLKEDVQKGTKNSAGKLNRKADVPEMKDDLWHVVRSIDFDHCDDKVALQVWYLFIIIVYELHLSDKQVIDIIFFKYKYENITILKVTR